MRARKTKTVLVVEDDVDLLELMQTVLRRAGHHVRIASNCREVLVRSQETGPCVVLIDLDRLLHMMEEKELANVVRDLSASLPVVVLAATEDAAQWALALGAAGYLSKPFDIGELLASIGRYGKCASSA